MTDSVRVMTYNMTAAVKGKEGYTWRSCKFCWKGMSKKSKQ